MNKHLIIFTTTDYIGGTNNLFKDSKKDNERIFIKYKDEEVYAIKSKNEGRKEFVIDLLEEWNNEYKKLNEFKKITLIVHGKDLSTTSKANDFFHKKASEILQKYINKKSNNIQCNVVTFQHNFTSEYIAPLLRIGELRNTESVTEYINKVLPIIKINKDRLLNIAAELSENMKLNIKFKYLDYLTYKVIPDEENRKKIIEYFDEFNNKKMTAKNFLRFINNCTKL